MAPCGNRPRRSSFTAEYKLRIFAEYEAPDEPGARGALLRREGLHSFAFGSSGAGLPLPRPDPPPERPGT